MAMSMLGVGSAGTWGWQGVGQGPLGSAVESSEVSPPYIRPKQNGSIRGICLESVSSGGRLPGQQKCGLS